MIGYAGASFLVYETIASHGLRHLQLVPSGGF
jgi:hypothetical protein